MLDDFTGEIGQNLSWSVHNIITYYIINVTYGREGGIWQQLFFFFFKNFLIYPPPPHCSLNTPTIPLTGS